MPIQKTFTIIPQAGGLASDAAGRSPSAARPMTSKQVRKAYKAANRMPPMSKAERIKQDRAEQERIKKEFEKERTAARAKAAREKKREKELAEREEKRRKGMPLVSVRPSQDTIARFVRGNGSGKKRDAGGRDVGDKDTPAPAPVPPIQEEQDEQENPSHEEIRPTSDIALKCDAVPDADALELELLQDLDMTSENDDRSPLHDENIQTNAGNDPKPLHDDPEPSIDQELDLIPDDGDDEHPLPDETEAPNPQPTKENSEPKMLQELDLIPEEDDLELEMLALEAISTPKQPLGQESGGGHSANEDHQQPARKATVYETDLGLNSRSSGEAPISDPHPAKPPDPKPPTRSMSPPPPPRRRSPSPISPIAAQAQPPPLSTQAILFNFDDFFPTSSQQARELEEETEFMTPKPSTPDPMPETEAQPPQPEPSLPSPPTASESPVPRKRFFTSSGTNEMLAVALLRSRRTAEREERQRGEMMQMEAIEQAKLRQQEDERKAREEKLAAQRREKAKVSNAINQQRPNGRPRHTPPSGTNKKATPTVMRSTPPIGTKKHAPPGGMNMGGTPLVEMRRTPPMQTNVKKPSSMQATKKIPHPETHKPHAQMNKTIVQSVGNKPPTTTVKNPPPREAKPKMSLKEANKENIPPAGNAFTCPSASQETEYGGDWIDEAAMELMF